MTGRLLSLFCALLLLAGCATKLPAPHDRSAGLDEQDQLFRDAAVTDARYQDIHGFEHMKVDDQLRRLARRYPYQGDLKTQKAFIHDFITRAVKLNDRLVAETVMHIPQDRLERFLAEYHEDMDLSVGGRTPQERFLKAYRKHAAEEVKLELDGLAGLTDIHQVEAYWYDLVNGMEQSIKTKGRVQRLLITAPLVPFIQAWILYHALTDDPGPRSPDFAASQTYLPPRPQAATDPARLQGWALLEYYAPLVVQERAENPAYAPESDHFGEVYLSGATLAEATPGVHTDRPTLYAYQVEKEIQGIRVRQLIYTLWYPEHPAMKRFDPEAGPMEGWTFRITLNRDNRPLMYESVSNCGCYYKVFPTERMESWASREYPEKEDGKRFFLEHDLPRKIDAIVPELVAVPEGPPQRVGLFYSAGHHQLITVRLESQLEESGAATQGPRYALLPYERLENLPFNGYHASLFGEDGLVRKAHRPECTLLTPSGLYHAGHPRQRETQMIYFDQADFDDPELFETYLRLPDKAFGRAL